MNRPGFPEGVAVALALSLAGSLAATVLPLVVPAGTVLRLVVTGSSLAYLVYLLSRAQGRVGRPTTLALWTVLAAGIWPLSWPLLVLTQVVALWLIRSLYFHRSLPAVLADGVLSGLAFLAGVWAAEKTGSTFAAFWCFFLVQALFAWIPGRHAAGSPESAPPPEADRFQEAHRTAEAALRRWASLR